eukprot:TRINITY_DN15793_c0_g1_i2.p1 TRINITY_DN15793_c0_g1~~TRINITY_DN15793_c0_g1_i2.p1  ORF type:complete len:561 (+),score=66.98 TRINITY_DN15793_c0_g1_i2:92-1774(+)
MGGNVAKSSLCARAGGDVRLQILGQWVDLDGEFCGGAVINISQEAWSYIAPNQEAETNSLTVLSSRHCLLHTNDGHDYEVSLLEDGSLAISHRSSLLDDGSHPSLKNEERPRWCLHRHSVDIELVGASTKLLAFITRCAEQDTPRLTSAQFRELRDAVGIIRGGGSKQISELFDDEAEDVMNVLGITRTATKYRHITNRWALVRHVYRFTSMLTPDANARNTINKQIEHMRSIDFRGDGGITKNKEVIKLCLSNPCALVAKFEIDSLKLSNWIHAIALKYRANPFHNWEHALETFQFLYMSLFVGELNVHIESVDMLALLLGALAHDVGHPGKNNAFLMNTRADLAISYNDKSVLENMHASVCFQTLFEPANNFFENAEPSDFALVRTKMIEAILATDLSTHFDLMDKLDHVLLTVKDDSIERAADASKVVISAFMHLADLGHTMRPWDKHVSRVAMLEAELFDQGDEEKRLGVPVMPLCDRNKDCIPCGQEFFLSKLVKPLMDPCADLLQVQFGECLGSHLATNQRMWKDLVEKHGKMSAAELQLRLKEENGHSSLESF